MVTDLSLLKYSELGTIFLSLAKVFLTEEFYNKVLILYNNAPEVGTEAFGRLPMKKSIVKHFTDKNIDIGLGQLFQKEEAAGKVRTFALVDSWTQTVLSPLHDYISNILKNIPNDGTSSHLAAFDRVRTRSLEYGCSYGYDLSAATDRLPVSLQVSLLNGLLGKGVGDL